MKRIIKYLGCVVVVAAMACGTAMAKGVVTKVYLFGFAASFNDSTVYFTNIQAVDSAWVDTKSKFLLGRSNYSYQLRDYLAEKKDMPHRTCVVVFDTDSAKADKKYQKMKSYYTEKSKGRYDVRYLTAQDFRFSAVDAGDQDELEEQQAKRAKEAKKARKAKRPKRPRKASEKTKRQ